MIDVDLTNVQLPILGNTNVLTANSQKPTEMIDDPTKMNNFVSWYLGGVNNRAEQGEVKNTEYETLNLSGPLQKLLPSIIQDKARIDSVTASYTTVSSAPDAGEANPDPVVNEPSNHNQIVVCANNSMSILPEWLRKILAITNIGIEKPVPCYPSANSGPQGDMVLRLSDWNKESSLQAVINTASDALKLMFPGNIITQIIADSANRWPKTYPPLPWKDAYGKPFTSDLLYQKAYNEWRGKLCILVGKALICLSPYPIVSNPYADLFQFVPLANTVDKKGMHTVTNTHISAPKAVVLNPKYEIIHSAQLYLAHSQEDSQLLDLLQSTYKPKESTGTGTPAKPSIQTDIENNSMANCRIIPSYINPGDFATFTVPKSHIQVNTHYDIKSVECPEQKLVCKMEGNPPHQVCRLTPTSCTADVYATINTIAKIPYADKIWQTSVAAPDSIFRRIYPKTGEGSPVKCIADNTAVSLATYKINQAVSAPGISINRIVEPDGSSVQGNRGDQPVDAQLYYPHYGSVLSYFLNGIQTALRPQGFGLPVPADGQYCSTNTKTGKCRMWLFEKSGSGYYYNNIIQAASSVSCNGKSLNPFWAIAIALNEDGGLLSDDPIGKSKYHFGCNLSQVQTIEQKISCMTYTLLNDCLAGKTDEETLQEYGYPPGYVLWPLTVLDPGGKYPPPLFGGGFNTTQLIANLKSANWVAAYQSVVPKFCPKSPILVPPGTP
jgi:hypothetical protein